MTDSEYAELARQDSTWREIVASFAIEGMTFDQENLIIVGKMISGEIQISEAIRLIRKDARVAVQEGEARTG